MWDHIEGFNRSFSCFISFFLFKFFDFQNQVPIPINSVGREARACKIIIEANNLKQDKVGSVIPGLYIFWKSSSQLTRPIPPRSCFSASQCSKQKTKWQNQSKHSICKSPGRLKLNWLWVLSFRNAKFINKPLPNPVQNFHSECKTRYLGIPKSAYMCTKR